MGSKKDLNQTTSHLSNYWERSKSTLIVVNNVIAHIRSSYLARVLTHCNVYSLKVQEAHCRLQNGIHRGFKIMYWNFKLNCPKWACTKLAHVQHAIKTCEGWLSKGWQVAGGVWAKRGRWRQCGRGDNLWRWGLMKDICVDLCGGLGTLARHIYSIICWPCTQTMS